jgi:hypothetical protein
VSATDEGRICEFEFFGPVNGGYAYCRIERVCNQGLPERDLVVQFTRNRWKRRDPIPDGMSDSAAIDAIRNPRPDKWPYWGRALEQSRAEELENGLTRSYSIGRGYSR